uniref:Uncharacterized protein n=1 Tax=Romanomermis culicivorax TaxID=13658 RepID=A0A915JHS2_ROMCU
MTSDFCDNAAMTHTTYCGAHQNLPKIQNGFRRRHSIKSVDADTPSPIINGKCMNGKFLPPLSTSVEETTFISDRTPENGTLSAENLHLEYIMEPAAHPSTLTGMKCAQKCGGGLLDQLRSTQLVYWTMTLSFIINYFWNRRHNLRAFFAAWVMLAVAAFFAALFFATVVLSYLFYDLPRKMSSSLPAATTSSVSPSYCSLGEENSPFSSRRSSTILPSLQLSASDDSDSNNSDFSTFYSCSRTPETTTIGGRKSPASAHFWQGNVSTDIIYYGRSFKTI